MTRINLHPPIVLSDQHLKAEIKEVNQLCGQFLKSVNSKKGIQGRIPKEFRLGEGHVMFFYDKGKYLHKRFNLLKAEAIKRGMNITASFNNVFKDYPNLYNDWEPNEKDLQIVKERINIRLSEKNNWYRYYGKIKDCTL